MNYEPLFVVIDGYALGAIVVVGLVVIALARAGIRFFRDHGVRVVRFGFFIERRRVVDVERIESWTPDPLAPSRDQETRPAPIPPPIPPPPLPSDEATWPQREEGL